LHIEESEQRAMRRRAALDRLEVAGVPGGSRLALEPIPAPEALGYRSRARFQIAADRAGGGEPRVGYHAPGSRHVVDVPECPLLAPELARAYAALRAALARIGCPVDLTGIELTALPATEGALAWVNPRDRAPEAWPEWGRRLLDAGDGALAAVAVQPGRHARGTALLGTSPVVGRTPGGRPVAAAPGTFLQANLAGADRLAEAVVDRAVPRPGERVIELFAGSGLLGWSLAAAAGAHVTAVETHPAAVSAAAALPAPPAGRLEASREEAGRALRRLSEAGSVPELVVANPPRSGLGAARQALLAAAPSRVVLVCCSHAGFAEDAAAMCRHGYALTRPALVDMFPQTRHPELLGLFVRS
jgi:23S rRNA (uracil1939-C5)-methyltransferase